jgi:hypothetical protein
MATHADKTCEQKSQSNTIDLSQKHTDKLTSWFVDIRPESTAQRRLQSSANNSPLAKQLRTNQLMAISSPQARQLAQLRAMAFSDFTKQQVPVQAKPLSLEHEHGISSPQSPIQMWLQELPVISSLDKKLIPGRTKALNDQVKKYKRKKKKYDPKSKPAENVAISIDGCRKLYKILIEISFLANKLGLYSSEIGTIKLFLGKLKIEMNSVQKKMDSILTKEMMLGKELDQEFAEEFGDSGQEEAREGDEKYLAGPKPLPDEMQFPLASGPLRNDPSEGEESHPLASAIEHFAPSMEGTVAAPADMTSAVLSSGADESMGNISSLSDANEGLSIGLSAFGQLTSLSSLMLATKRLTEAGEDSDEKNEAKEEIANSTIALFKTTAAMADTIVNMQTTASVEAAKLSLLSTVFNNSGNAEAITQQINNVANVQSAANSATTATGSVAAAAGIVWNAFQLVLNAYEADKAGKAFDALQDISGVNRQTFPMAVKYAEKRVKRKRIRRAVNATNSGLGIVAGAVGIAIAAGVAATPAGWALMAAGLMIGVGILGYKIGKYAYKKLHRKDKASDLIIDMDSLIPEDKQNAEIYLTQVLGLDVETCREMKAKGQTGKLKADILERMENKRNVIAIQLLKALENKDGPDYAGAVQILKALRLVDVEIIRKDPNKSKRNIVQALASW